MRQQGSVFWIWLLFLLLAGCKGGGNEGILTPPLTPSDLSAMSIPRGPGLGGHALWGIWQAQFDPDTHEFEAVPLREGTFHLNVVGQLQAPKPPGLALSINEFDPATAYIDFDLTITHPYPDSNLRVFDTRGIFMGSGPTLVSKADSGLVYLAPSGLRLLNADGYTRWWNPTEFSSPGMFGFEPGKLGFPSFKPSATLHPFKYFADSLSATDPVVPGVNLSNRGTFSTTPVPSKLSRNYKLVFPIVGGKPVWLCQYAIDANWAPPIGGSPKPKPIGDFPLEANCPEAFHIAVDSAGSTAYYISDSDKGGSLNLKIEVFDWGVSSNPEGINGEVESIIVESDTLFDSPVEVPLVPGTGSQPVSGIYEVTIPNVHPTGLADQEVLVTVRSKDPTTYESPISWPAYPESAQLAAYNLVSVPILEVNPYVESITVLEPNGGDSWIVGYPKTVKWSWTGEIDAVDILMSTDGGGTWPITIADDAPNSGQYPVSVMGSWVSNQARVRVLSSSDSSVADNSDANFTVSYSSEPVTVITPNGGESYGTGESMNIEWASNPSISNVKIALSLDSGGSYPLTVADSTPNDGFYKVDWIPPAAASPTCRIRISDTANQSVYDSSDADFDVHATSGYIHVTGPNGGEVWGIGNTHMVQWTANSFVSKVRIDLSLDGGSTWPVCITPYNDNTGFFKIPEVGEWSSTQARIRVSDAFNASIFDTSDNDFEIKALSGYVTVIVPNGGETWQVGSSQTIEYSAHHSITTLKISYSTNGGNNWTPVTTPDGTYNTGSYVWDDIPEAAVSTHCRIKIIESGYNYQDTSDSDFTIECNTPPAPSDFEASQGTDHQCVMLSWKTEVKTTYNVYMDDPATPIVTGIKPDQVPLGICSNYSVVPGVHYQFWVQAVTECGAGDKAGPAEGWACDSDLPGDPPQQVIASQGTYQSAIVLTWDSVPGATGYNIYRDSTELDPAYVENWPNNYYVDTDVEPCESHSYIVEGTDGCLTTYASHPEATGFPASPPAPTGVTASQGDYPKKIVVQWNKVTDVSEYDIYRDDFSSPDFTGIEGTIFEDVSVQPNEEHWYWVGITGCPGVLGGPVEGSTCAGLDPPLNVTASQGTYPYKVLVQWEAVAGASGYDIYRDTWTTPFVVDWQTTSWEDTKAGSCEHHFYRVAGVQGGFEGELSFAPGAEGWVSDDQPAGTPGWVSASQGEFVDYVHLSWELVNNASGYYVYRDYFSQPVWTVEDNTPEWDDCDAVPGIHHQYCVKAFNECGEGQLTDPPVEGWLLGPSTPGNVVATIDLCDEIQVTWDTVPDATGYIVEWKLVQYDTWLPLATDWPYTYWDDSTIAPQATRLYRIKALIGDMPGEPGYSNEGKRIGSPVPSGITASQGEFPDKIRIHIPEGVPFAIYYDIYRDNWMVPYETDVPYGTGWWEDTNLAQGETHYYRVAAVSSACGESPLSTPAAEGWTEGLPVLVLQNCPGGMVCDNSYMFTFDPDQSGTFKYLYYSKDNQAFQKIPWTDQWLWSSIEPGPHNVRFKVEFESGGETPVVSCDFFKNSSPQISNFNCPDSPIVTQQYLWTWELYDLEAELGGPDTLSVWIYLDGPSYHEEIHLDDFATEYQLNTSDLTPEAEYTAQVEVRDACGMVAATDICIFTVNLQDPALNCPPQYYTNCDGSYMFNWNIVQNGSPTPPEDLWVRCKWSQDGNWEVLGQGITSHEVTWNQCLGNDDVTFEVEVSESQTDWTNAWDNGTCAFYILPPSPPDAEFTQVPPSTCAEIGQGYHVEWTMSDECTPADQLRVVVELNSGEEIELPPGTTSYDVVSFKQGDNKLEVFIRNDCYTQASLYTSWDADAKPTVDITNCPATVPAYSDYTFEWAMDDIEDEGQFLEVSIKYDAGGWVTLPIGTTSKLWSGISPGPHTFNVRVKDNCLHTVTDSCTFDAI